MKSFTVIIATGVAGIALAACSSSADPPTTTRAAHTAKVTPAKVTPTTVASTTTTGAAPAAPNNPATIESDGGTPTPLLLQQIGSGSGSSNTFIPAGAVAASQSGPSATGIVRLRVEWACAPGSAVTNVHLADGSGDISGPLMNGFDGPVPVSDPPAKVVWAVHGSCNWHVRALEQ